MREERFVDDGSLLEIEETDLEKMNRWPSGQFAPTSDGGIEEWPGVPDIEIPHAYRVPDA